MQKCPNGSTLFLSVVLLLLPHLLGAAPACPDTIRYCQNCHYNPDSNCRQEPSLGNIAQSAIESKCIELLEQDRSLYAVVYSSTEKKCFTYNCLHAAVLTYVLGQSTYMRTCDTGMKPVSFTVNNMSGVNIYTYAYTYTV